MAVEAQIKNKSNSMKEFESLLDEDFKDRKLKENQIIKANRAQTSDPVRL